MLQLLSIAMFVSIIVLSITVVIETLRAEMPYVRRALGLDAVQRPLHHAENARRVRVIRQPKLRPAPAVRVRAAA